MTEKNQSELARLLADADLPLIQTAKADDQLAIFEADKKRWLHDLRDYEIDGDVKSGPHNVLTETTDRLRGLLGVEPHGMKKADLRDLVRSL